ncbi:T9SS type A sorting domain-containing protein [Reichenbachiella carrageenanivorans]|uniref:T9SS type A sorting domain-containing protein n=1 Tax=Reichenbachiella carrageenanivorans TaxID=2979869 RepID=A0ABY6CXW5_9BACT|nr:T9SS type A sorting domain-containing protein [Reichenbachiella carrageenanivorans]UXX78757.1 T9SS type A sorting domain-containing protein [Reichenbachiella carrageenanivorans]
MYYKSCRIGLLVWFVFIALTSQAQLEVRPIPIQVPLSGQHGVRVADVGDTLSLPFWDDFSFASLIPSEELWASNTGAIINGTLGKISPTVNVVSFDGIDLTGNPHQPPTAVGSAATDVLTSKPINLLLPVEKQDSVYFSFFWQMRGYGEVPEHKDSLKVFFKNKHGEWIMQFEKQGLEENLHETFTKEMIQIESDDFFHEGFQFRFQAAGNGTGPFDIWNIDYVYLNQDRHETDESLWDRAFGSMPSSMFSQYTMIPYDVIFDFPDTIYQDMTLEMTTLEDGRFFPTYDFYIRDTLTKSLLYTQPTATANPINNFGRNTVQVDAIKSADLQSIATDSLFLELEFIFNTDDGFFVSAHNPTATPSSADTVYLNDPFYNYRLNDTIRSYHEVHETLAYDDGSAEYAAGLNKVEGQLAVSFVLPSSDTLTHVDIYFPQINPLPAGERITLSVLSQLTDDDVDVRRSQDFFISGGAGVNEFSRFTFETPVIVNGEFFIVMKQYTSDYIGIGLDKDNLLGKQKIFMNIENGWEPNYKVDGMVMIRAGFANSDFVVSDVEYKIGQLNIFPNPVQYTLNVQGIFDYYEIMDLSGQTLKSGRTQQVEVSDLVNGLYLIRITSGPLSETRKIVVQH